MSSDHRVCSEPPSKHSPASNTSSAAKVRSHTCKKKNVAEKGATGGMIHFSGKLDGSGLIILTIAATGFTMSCKEGQRLACLISLDKREECKSNDSLSALEHFIFGLKNVITFANRCTKKPVLVEIFDSVDRLQFTLFLPRKELRYGTRYVLEEPGVLLELMLPTEANLDRSLRSYLDSLALGFFFLCHPRITFHIPTLRISEDFLPRYHMTADEEYLRSTLSRIYKRDFVASSSDISKSKYSIAAAVCISPSQEPIDLFPVDYVIVVNNTPLVGLRSPLCPATLENLDFLAEYDISLNRLSLADELALGRPFSSFYKANPHNRTLIDSCVVIVAIYFENNIELWSPDRSFLTPCPTISSDISSCLMCAFSECVSKFPSGLRKVAERRQQALQLSAKHVITDIEALSSLLLTEEELRAFTRRHNAVNLGEAISKVFSSILNGRNS